MFKRPLALTLASMAVLAIAVGCGSSGDESSTTTITTSSLSKSQWMKNADSICERGRNEAVARAGTTTIVVAIQKGILPSFQATEEKIRELGAPKGDEAKIEAFEAALQKEIETARAQRPEALSTFENLFKPSGQIARTYGISACAYG